MLNRVWNISSVYRLLCVRYIFMLPISCIYGLRTIIRLPLKCVVFLPTQPTKSTDFIWSLGFIWTAFTIKNEPKSIWRKIGKVSHLILDSDLLRCHQTISLKYIFFLNPLWSTVKQYLSERAEVVWDFFLGIAEKRLLGKVWYWSVVGNHGFIRRGLRTAV